MPLNYDVHGISIRIWGPGPGTDEYGNTIETPGTMDKGTIKAILSAPSLSSMINGFQGRSDTSDKLLLAAADANIVTGDQVEVDGRRYNTVGSGDTWKRYHMGVVDHLEIPLRAA
jgi:hypothetical protein